jgi:hypothetical protein
MGACGLWAALGIKDNLCGQCTALPGGGVKLYSRHGLRFNGASFDDNQNGFSLPPPLPPSLPPPPSSLFLSFPLFEL